MTSRRRFLRIVPLTGLTLLGQQVLAQSTPAMASEKDPQAVALGYVADAKRVDKAKYPKYAPPQHCAICQFYQAAATAPTAPCAILGGKGVAGPGWCSAFAAKPA